MGKTNPTYRDTLSEFENDWAPYRRALRLEYKDHFDRLFDQARNFADAGGIQNHPDPMTTHLVSILLAQECRIADLKNDWNLTASRLNHLSSNGLLGGRGTSLPTSSVRTETFETDPPPIRSEIVPTSHTC